MEATALRMPNTVEESHERLRAQDDIETQFSELVDGSMRTSFEFEFDGYDLRGRDGRGLLEVADKALAEARRMVRKNPELWFEVRRRSIERDEIKLAIRMARGEEPNTMVIESDFPPELMATTEDVGGYNVKRKQTMQRVLAWDGKKLHMFSQSLDGSYRHALEAIYAHFGEKPEPGELLGQRIHVNLPPEEQVVLSDHLTGIYDRALTDQYGGEWYAGRRPADYRNTYDFVRQQRDLIQACIDMQVRGQMNDKIMYDMSATMRARFKNGTQSVISAVLRQEIVNPIALQMEIMQAGKEARATGQSFSACGVTLKPGGADTSLESQLEEAGYGNKKDPDADCEYTSKQCPMCKAKNVKTVDKKIPGTNKRKIEGACGCSVKYVKH